MTGLFALGETKGVFEKGTSTDAPFPCTYGDCEGTINLDSWKARTDAGDPTSPEDPIIRQIRRGLTEFRGAYYQDEGWSSRWTAARSLSSRSRAGPTTCSRRSSRSASSSTSSASTRAGRSSSRWRTSGHSRAQNKPETWHP